MGVMSIAYCAFFSCKLMPRLQADCSSPVRTIVFFAEPACSVVLGNGCFCDVSSWDLRNTSAEQIRLIVSDEVACSKSPHSITVRVRTAETNGR